MTIECPCLYCPDPDVGWCDKREGFIGVDFPEGECYPPYPVPSLKQISKAYIEVAESDGY